jgi:hypothetical protein
VPIACPGGVALPSGDSISCRRKPITPEEFSQHQLAHPAGLEWFDAQEVHGPLLCRAVSADDAFWPLGASCRRSVREFIKKQSSRAGSRQDAFCVCDELRIDSRVRVTDRTKEVIELQIGSRLTREPCDRVTD